MRFVIFIFTLFFISHTSATSVDLRNGSLNEIWVDYSQKGFKIQREYNNQSTFSGIFGYGWCSNLETRLVRTKKGTLLRKPCGDGYGVEYFPKKSKGVFSYLPLHKSNSSSISFSGREFIYRNGRTSEVFNAKGRLKKVVENKKTVLNIMYSKGRPHQLTTPRQPNISIKYSKTGKIRLIKTGKLKLSYKHSSNLLIENTDARNVTYSYKYNSAKNLSQVTFPDRSKKKYRYDNKRDIVTLFSSPNGCQEKFSYQLDKRKKSKFQANSVLICPKQKSKKTSYSIATNNKGLIQHLRKATNGRENYSISFDKKNGAPVKVKNRGKLYTYSYYENGLVKQKKVNKNTVFYKYVGNSKAISSLVVKSKKIKKQKIDFSYNKQRKISSIKNGNKLTRLKYDKNGFLSHLINSQKDQLFLKFDPLHRKPTLLHLKKQGKIEIAYDKFGQVSSYTKKPSNFNSAKISGSISSFLELFPADAGDFPF